MFTTSLAYSSDTYKPTGTCIGPCYAAQKQDLTNIVRVHATLLHTDRYYTATLHWLENEGKSFEIERLGFVFYNTEIGEIANDINI